MKRILLISVLSICLLFAVGLTPKNSEAGSLIQVIFDDVGHIWVAVADFGILFDNEWELIVKTDIPATDPFGFGFRFFNPVYAELGMIILADSFWFAHGCFADLDISNACNYSIANGAQGIWNLSASPFPKEQLRASAETGQR
jgi:hypothetical protein